MFTKFVAFIKNLFVKKPEHCPITRMKDEIEGEVTRVGGITLDD